MARRRRRQLGSGDGSLAAARQLRQLGSGMASILDDSHDNNNDKNKHNNQTVHGRGRRMTLRRWTTNDDNKDKAQR